MPEAAPLDEVLGVAARGALVAACAAARPLTLLLDIDGTLAPIVPHADDARIPDATLALLAALAALPDTTLVFVTGRGAHDGRRLAAVAHSWVVGNHGAERLAPDGTHAVDPRIAAHAASFRDAVAALGPLLALEGVRVEDKRWSLSVHYRQAAPEHAPHVVAEATAVAERLGLRAGGGKQVVELRAPVAVDKGSAALALLEALGADTAGGAVLAAGDDVTDEDLFRQLRSHLVAARPYTVRVGAAGVPTHAAARVATVDDFRDLLAAVTAARGAVFASEADAR